MDTNVSSQSWLVLLPQLPPKPDYLRVKLQRRLGRLGVVQVKNGVYALPFRTETSAGCEELRAEIIRDGGELVVLARYAAPG